MSVAPHLLASVAQLALFRAIEASGQVVVAVGSPGARANLVGGARVRRHGGEDRIDVDDGTHHVHVDWARLGRAEVTVQDGEGLVEFFDGEVPLLRVYRIAGPFESDVEAAARAVAARTAG
jgi:hypothetical protein